MRNFQWKNENKETKEFFFVFFCGNLLTVDSGVGISVSCCKCFSFPPGQLSIPTRTQFYLMFCRKKGYNSKAGPQVLQPNLWGSSLPYSDRGYPTLELRRIETSISPSSHKTPRPTLTKYSPQLPNNKIRKTEQANECSCVVCRTATVHLPRGMSYQHRIKNGSCGLAAPHIHD